VRQYAPFVLILTVPLGCNKAAPPPPAAAAETAAAKVKTSHPKQQVLSWTVELPGTVEPLEITPIIPKLSGYVKEFAPDLAAVKKGDPVAGRPIAGD
jgi:multidrug efflux pump subunit AcrA (membrane-fusion protein)